MGKLLMTQKERNRMVVLIAVTKNELKLVQGAELMAVSYRQAKRLIRRFKARGEAGLVHRSRGRPSGRCKAATLRRRVLARYQQRYAGFGPTLAAEHLAGDGLAIDHETLRRWLQVAGVRLVRRRGQQHRARRERKACFGEMVQMDGSEHDWLEGRGPRMVLMVMIDDATNQTGAQFFPGETTRASFEVFAVWVETHGVPGSIYVDRDSIYRAEGLPSVAEQLEGRSAPPTQFGRAMEQLGVRLILAHSPQAKGRVERRHGVFQDRLVKEMRLKGIKDLAGANRYLARRFLPELNRRFTLAAVNPTDVHRAGLRDWREVLSWEYERLVQRDWTVSWQRRCFQIEAGQERLSLVGKRIKVRELRDGGIQLLDRGRKLRWRELSGRPAPVKLAPKPARPRVSKPPKAKHPWRRFGRGTGRPHWRGVKAEGRAARGGAALELRDSGRPPLRSGLPPSLNSSAAKKGRTHSKTRAMKHQKRGHFHLG